MKPQVSEVWSVGLYPAGHPDATVPGVVEQVEGSEVTIRVIGTLSRSAGQTFIRPLREMLYRINTTEQNWNNRVWEPSHAREGATSW